jgi:hypothetical protein
MDERNAADGPFSPACYERECPGRVIVEQLPEGHDLCSTDEADEAAAPSETTELTLLRTR